MVPDPEKNKRWLLDEAGSGTVYRVNALGPDIPVWSVSGWYAHETHLTDDGECLVRLGNWHSGWDPSPHDLAIAFYERDKLMAQYSTSDLVMDTTRVRRSVSHYQWLTHVYGLAPGGSRFSLTTVDGILYTFKACSGELVSKGPSLDLNDPVAAVLLIAACAIMNFLVYVNLLASVFLLQVPGRSGIRP
jgi:hypothetical protein